MKRTRLSRLQILILEQMQENENQSISIEEVELLTRAYVKKTNQRYRSIIGIRAVTSLSKKPYIEILSKNDEVVGLQIASLFKPSSNNVTLITGNEEIQGILAKNLELENSVIPSLKRELTEMKKKIKSQTSKINRLQRLLNKKSSSNKLIKFFSGTKE